MLLLTQLLAPGGHDRSRKEPEKSQGRSFYTQQNVTPHSQITMTIVFLNYPRGNESCHSSFALVGEESALIHRQGLAPTTKLNRRSLSLVTVKVCSLKP